VNTNRTVVFGVLAGVAALLTLHFFGQWQQWNSGLGILARSVSNQANDDAEAALVATVVCLAGTFALTVSAIRAHGQASQPKGPRASSIPTRSRGLSADQSPPVQAQGWYADPWGDGLRWWDGRRWTGSTAGLGRR
jgi:hypothetical protein